MKKLLMINVCIEKDDDDDNDGCQVDLFSMIFHIFFFWILIYQDINISLMRTIITMILFVFNDYTWWVHIKGDDVGGDVI